MPRSWNTLTPAYRKRLTAAGITQTQYEAGASVTTARGHATTPERPERAEKNPTKYQRYLGERNRLVQLVIDRKTRLFGPQPRYNHAHSETYVKKGVPHLPGYPPGGKPPTITKLRAILAEDDHTWLERARSQAKEDSFLWYH